MKVRVLSRFIKLKNFFALIFQLIISITNTNKITNTFFVFFIISKLHNLIYKLIYNFI